MGSEQVFKKSVLGGFKKEGVLDYIEQLQSEIIELKKEISNKPDYSKEVEELKETNKAAVSEIAALTAKYDAVKAENESLSERNSDLIAELDEAKKKNADYEEKQKLFEEKISAIETKFVQLASGYQKNDESSARVNDAVENARIEVTDATERIKTACNNFESSSSALKSSVENLLSILSDIYGAETDE